MKGCAGRRAGITAELPRKAEKPPRRRLQGAAFWLTDGRRVLLRRRPPHGLLGGMTELPGTAWREAPWTEAEALALAPMPAAWRRAGEVRHIFTHIELRLDVFTATVKRIDGEGFLHPLAALGTAALPSLMLKCAAAAGQKVSRRPPPQG
jgi:A/G-specific adenine glycosylase